MANKKNGRELKKTYQMTIAPSVILEIDKRAQDNDLSRSAFVQKILKTYLQSSTH